MIKELPTDYKVSANELQEKLDELAAKAKLVQDICAEHQKNIDQVEKMKTDITAWLRHGEDVHISFLKACKIISLLTDDKKYFYRCCDYVLDSLYGRLYALKDDTTDTISADIEQCKHLIMLYEQELKD